MSNWAMGWAQRQTLGDPVCKAVLQTMCYVLRDEVLLVFVGIPTLCEYTEYDDRTVRKALARLAELGVLLDTGRKKNNVTVWRIPGYEAWLRRQQESHGKNGRASETDAKALAQVTELTKEKSADDAANPKPPQKGEGTEQAPPFLQSSPPISASQALPKMGGNLEDLYLPLSPGAREDDPPGFIAAESQRHWANHVVGQVLGAASALGIAPYRAQTFERVPLYQREALKNLSRELTAEAIGAERQWHPMKPFQRRKIEAHIDKRIGEALRVLRPPTPSEMASIAANG